MKQFLRRTWVEVNLDNIDYNYQKIREHIPKNSEVMCIVKADAYGHGATVLAREYERLGAKWLAVSNLEEAIQIREHGIKLPILILGYTPVERSNILSEYNISQAVLSEQYAIRLNNRAIKNKYNVKVHVKLDTGMNRLGIQCQSIEDVNNAITTIEKISRLGALKIEGVFTHFAVADSFECGQEFTHKQNMYFNSVITGLQKKNIKIPIIHCANSATIVDYPEMSYNMVRPGIILYGLLPSKELKCDLDLKPAMEFKTAISLIKTIHKDMTVGYGRKFTAQKTMRIATVPVGYADGYPRSLSSRGYVLVNGKKADILGNICMDQMMIDVTEISDVNEGDTVVLFGASYDRNLSIDEVAQMANTISYEIICSIGKRVQKRYYKSGKLIAQISYIT